jgi:RNA polymerase sigma factor for flagellar operon FliA
MVARVTARRARLDDSAARGVRMESQTVGEADAAEVRAREHALVLEHWPRVRSVVNRLAQRLPPDVDREELVQGGALGLIDAARRFDPAQGCSFAVYAEIRVRGAVLDQLRALDLVPRRVRRCERALERGRREVEQRVGRAAELEEVASQLGLSIEELEALRANLRCAREQPTDGLLDDEGGASPLRSPWSDAEEASPLRALDARRDRQLIATALEELPEAERDVVSLLYWSELPPEEAAHALGWDVGRVRSLHARGLLRLRSRLRALYE